MRRLAAIALVVAAVGSTAFADPVLDQSNDPTPTVNAGMTFVDSMRTAELVAWRRRAG